jgi:HEAT repeat protein
MEELETTPKEIPFSEVITALLNNNQPFPAVMMPSLSDISEKNLESLIKVWGQIADQRRIGLMEDMHEIQDQDTISNFSSIAEFALDDPLAPVRTLAISMLWEWPNKETARRLLSIIENDDDMQVRASACNGLGNYVYLAELDEFSSSLADQIVDTLLRVIKSDAPKLVRRRALEAVSFSSREDVAPLIEAAFRNPDREWMMSALFAMGRSCDECWTDQVMSCLNHAVPEVQFEAVRSAGELEIEDAREILIELLEDYQNLDDDVRIAAVVALSKIGGENVRATLETLVEEVTDEDEAEIISTSLENLDFLELGILPGMLDLDQFNLGRHSSEEDDDSEEFEEWDEDLDEEEDED